MTPLKGKVFITALSFSRYTPEPKNLLEEQGLELVWNDKGRPLTEDELREIMTSHPSILALLVGVDPVTAKVIEAAPKLKVIAKHGVGVDNIDISAARSRGVVVTNAPGSNTQSVADLVWGLLLAAARGIPCADRITRQKRWDRVVGNEVWEKTLGIIGTGRIGLAVAHRARGFNMRLLAYDPCPNNEAAGRLGITYTSLDDLLKESDFVSLHAPLTPETYHLIDEKKLGIMKKDAILINTARGELVDEEALYRALKTGQIKAAALDVFSEEPPTNSCLLGLDNVVVTPHLGAYTREANLKMGLAAAINIIKVLKGEKADFELNYEV
ncbi:phosphoglycerate dehydrogenase [Moorella sulfitireducens (nom. illeg.)]|uniref:phosphoglycerate dehydrogenase n=1 Tax=Neomoorella sulfitireducens TaxID=2972948 RepID=UPI0021ACB54C|nr:phosphoglycerate dehydrogenase [Moorella sulfitireducens]